MAPRIGPPAHLPGMKIGFVSGHKFDFPVVKQQFVRKMQPKVREAAGRHAKLLARWLHTQCSWRQALLTGMVLLVASKMVLLALTFTHFTLTTLVSLQIFHGVWTIAFLCLAVADTRARLLPHASCLLAGYLPATTVLHILLIPGDYPIQYIITDAATTLLAILTMFALLRLECRAILAEAEAEAERAWRPEAPASPGVPRVVLSRPRRPEPSFPAGREPGGRRDLQGSALGGQEAVDLEPIDFEHFLDEPDQERSHNLQNMFGVTQREAW